MNSLSNIKYAGLIIKAEFRQTSRRHFFRNLSYGKNNIYFWHSFNVFVPDKFKLTEQIHNVMHKGLITLRYFLFMYHQLITELYSSCSCKSLKWRDLTRKNKLFWFVLSWLYANLRNLDLIPGSHAHKW